MKDSTGGMHVKREYYFRVNGFDMTTTYEDRTVEELFLPLLRRWTELWRRERRRILVFLSAPPGVGKTTLAQLMEHLSRTEEGLEPLQAVGLDGFHYHADYIAAHTVSVGGREVPMKQVKGAPEAYDIEKLIATLQALRKGDVTWPIYDRNLHDVVEDAVEVTAGIVLVEGNWLLSTEGAWETVAEMCDDSIFIDSSPELLRDRLIARKIRGGLSPEAAEEFYERSDRANILRLMANHREARERWTMTADGTFARKVIPAASVSTS